VFPGGNFDAKQDSSLEMTAIRETFEESGLLIASSSDLSSDSSGLEDYLLDEARKSIHAQLTNFETFLSEHHLTADVSSLLPFTTWVTPSSAPRSVFLF
jgi:8-oxo-dGTP pyrophosphatase MutT (NUDIX family)